MVDIQYFPLLSCQTSDLVLTVRVASCPPWSVRILVV